MGADKTGGPAHTWVATDKWEAIVWVVLFLSLFGGCVVCHRNSDVPWINITLAEEEREG